MYSLVVLLSDHMGIPMVYSRNMGWAPWAMLLRSRATPKNVPLLYMRHLPISSL